MSGQEKSGPPGCAGIHLPSFAAEYYSGKTSKVPKQIENDFWVTVYANFGTIGNSYNLLLLDGAGRMFIYTSRPAKRTFFRTYFERGDIPVCSTGPPIKLNNPKKQFPIKWFCDPEKLDYCYYLPIFVDGISDYDSQMRHIAMYGAMDLILRGRKKILPVVPKLILPFKRSFNTRIKQVIIMALKVLQLMVVVGPCVGQALVPYYRQLLPVCNLYKQINVNLGDAIDPDRDQRIGDVIEDTLQTLEKCGGPDAYINIKYIIPTYESSVMN